MPCPHRLKAGAAALALLALTALLAAACGDDDAGTSAAPTTAAPSTTAVPPTTTTQAPVTTQTTTTTQATTTTSDLHPAWQVSWAPVWPEEGSTAVYRLGLFNQTPVDLPAVIEYGVEWEEGTWDRILIGNTEPGQYGLAFYFDRSTPWMIDIWGLRATGPNMGPQGSFDEYFGDVASVDLGGLPGTVPRLEVDAFVGGVGDEVFGPTPAVYAMEIVGLEQVVVPAGTWDQALHVRFGLGGEFFGVDEGQEITTFSDLWVAEGQLILRWDPAPGFGTPLELVSPWQQG